MKEPHSSLLRSLSSLFGGRNDLAKLLGRRVDNIYINKEKTIITFGTDQGFLSFEAEGDCCSESWFEHINGIENIIGQTVDSGDETTMGDLPGTRQDVDQVYSIKLHTKKGTFEMEMRNSSNGYYGDQIRKSENHQSQFLLTENF